VSFSSSVICASICGCAFGRGSLGLGGEYDRRALLRATAGMVPASASAAASCTVNTVRIKPPLRFCGS
jgi:hypothetical protein